MSAVICLLYEIDKHRTKVEQHKEQHSPSKKQQRTQDLPEAIPAVGKAAFLTFSQHARTLACELPNI